MSRYIRAAAWEDLARPAADREVFHPDQLTGLPDTTQRFLGAALSPDVVLSPVVLLEMEGEIKLKDWTWFRGRQVLRGGEGFVWGATAGRPAEIEAGDAAIWFHLTAEALMVLLLITDGWLVLRFSGGWGLGVSALTSGSLIYLAVNSAGYFAETGDWPLVVFFATILVLTVAAVILLLPEVGAGRSIERRPR